MMKKGINEFAGIFMDINIPKQIGLVLSFLIEYILKEGRPDCLFIRNPAKENDEKRY